MQSLGNHHQNFRHVILYFSFWAVITRPSAVTSAWSPWSAVETALTLPVVRAMFGLEQAFPAAETNQEESELPRPPDSGEDSKPADENSFSESELPAGDDGDSNATARAGYGYGHSSVGPPSLFGFDSVVFGLALAAFGAFLIQFIVNLVNGAGRRRKRSLDGTGEEEHMLDMFTSWITPVIHGDYRAIWNDLDPDNEGVWGVMYNSLPRITDFIDTNEMLTQLAAMGEAVKNGHVENEVLFPENDGTLAKDVHKKLCQKYSLMNSADRVNARISKYYWFALTYSSFWKWAEPYLKSIGHGLDGEDCEEWFEDGTRSEEEKLEDTYGRPGEVSRSSSAAESAPTEEVKEVPSAGDTRT